MSNTRHFKDAVLQHLSSVWTKTCTHAHNVKHNCYHFQETYSTFPYSMMTIFVMTLGELNYADTFMPWGKLEYATLTNILFFMFVLGMPIILMNMLVSNIPRWWSQISSLWRTKFINCAHLNPLYLSMMYNVPLNTRKSESVKCSKTHLFKMIFAAQTI